MKLLQFAQPEQGSRLGLVKGDDVFDLTACAPHPASLHDLYYRHGGDKNSIETTVESINIHNAPRLSLRDLLDNTDDPDQPRLISPVTAPADATAQIAYLAGGSSPMKTARNCAK